ncbi:MAG TPA: response regulator [Gemmatimonadaceae bacterium]|nr:response regulator [Gemmatimonadaceae bacterium]
MTLSVQRKVYLGFGVALLILAVIGVASYRGLRQAMDAARWVAHTHSVIESVDDASRDVATIEAGSRGFILTGDAVYLGPFRLAESRLDATLTQLRAQVADNTVEMARAQAISELARRRMAFADTTVQVMQHAGQGAAVTRMRTGVGRALSDSIRLLASTMRATEHALLDDRMQVQHAQEILASVIILFGFLVACGVAALAAVTIRRDMYERERLDDQLRAAVDEARRANQAKSDFLARMSHELRTPLNSVIGFSNVLLKSRDAIGEQATAYVERIRTNGTHLLGIINDILDLSKVESGRMDVVLENVDVARLVAATVAQIAPRGGEGPAVDVMLPAHIAPLRTDAAKLRQVLLNLVTNAAKFTEGGRVVVRGVTSPANDELLRLDVVDAGIGIPQDRLDGIFNAFEQVDSATSRRYGGTGLGLAIARSMCERMGYTLSVVSTPAVGSTFSIRFTPDAPALERHEPVAPPSGPAASRMEPMPTRAPEPAPASAASMARVLIIDDSDDARDLLVHMARECGCEALAAASGTIGLDMALTHRPDVILLDLMMPDMDGFEVLRRLKMREATARIPVIVVSIVGTENESHLVGAVDVIDKPVSRDALGDAIRRNIGTGNSRVLVVDDSEDVRRLLSAYLADFPSLTVATANSAEDGLARLDSFTPGLILLDLMMPGMGGLEFLRQLRARERFHDTPVVVITGKSLTADERRILERETVTVLAKGPALGAELTRAVRSALARMHPPASGAAADD